MDAALINKKQKRFFRLTLFLLVFQAILAVSLLIISILLISLFTDFMSILALTTSFTIIVLTINLKPITFLGIGAMAATNLALALYYTILNVFYFIYSEDFKLLQFVLQLVLAAVAVIHCAAVCAISHVFKLTQRVVFPNAPDVNHPLPLLKISSKNFQSEYILCDGKIGVKSGIQFDIQQVSETIELGPRDRRKRVRRTPESIGEEAQE